MTARGSRAGRLVLLGFGLLLLGIALLAGCDTPAVFVPEPTPTATSTPIPTETPGPTPTPDPVRADDIAYIRRFIFGLSGDIYLVHADGLAPRQITSFTRDQPSAASDYPVWSPDRKTIAFASEYRDLYNLAVWNLYGIDPQGKGAHQMTGLPQPNNGYFPSLLSDIPGVSIWAMMTAPPGVPLHGRVLAKGKPVPGAEVVSWLGRGSVRSDANGYYTLHDVPPGQRGWVKALGESGAGWVWVTPAASGTTEVPDIALDPRLGSVEYSMPAWDRRGGLWSLYTQHWFDPLIHDPHFETALYHVSPDGSLPLLVYTAQSKTLGRPRANPAHPEQVAVVDGTDLLLLTTDLRAPAGPQITARRVVRRDVLRAAPVAWSPDGSKLYWTQPTTYNSTTDAGYESLIELDVATDAARTVTYFWPKERENTGFDLSPDGRQVVYEEYGDLFTRVIAAPQSTKPRHITYYGQSLRPTWGGN